MSPGCQMRIKGPLVLMVCILVTSIFYFLIGDPKPSLQNIVSETNRQLAQPLIKLKDAVVPAVADSSNYYLGHYDQKADNELSEKYLRILGFIENPRLYPQDVWHNVSALPVLVSAIKSGQNDDTIGLIKSVRLNLPNHTLLLYDLDLDEDELELINTNCNTSTCAVRKFEFDKFPSHVGDLKLSAYRPLIIQEVLDQTGAVLWLDPQLYVTAAAPSKLVPVIEDAQRVGVFSWTIQRPTSAMTHPKMFEYFRTAQKNYFFHRMVEPRSLVLFNTKRIHEELMRPWVKCALAFECIAPIGAQSSGCRFDKKPFFRYSGCHFYDASALNVILGIMFDCDEKQYTSERMDKFFELASTTSGTPTTSSPFATALRGGGVEPDHQR